MEINMIQWFTNNILSTVNMQMFESGPISDREFIISISMVCIAFAIFAVAVRVIGG